MERVFLRSLLTYGFQRLKPQYDEPLSNFAFKFNLRCYIEAWRAKALSAFVLRWKGIGVMPAFRGWRGKVGDMRTAGAYTRPLLSST